MRTGGDEGKGISHSSKIKFVASIAGSHLTTFCSEDGDSGTTIAALDVEVLGVWISEVTAAECNNNI